MPDFEQWLAAQTLSDSSANVYRTMWGKLQRYCLDRRLPLDREAVLRFCGDTGIGPSQSRRYVMLAARLTGDHTILKADYQFRREDVRQLPVMLDSAQAQPLLEGEFPQAGSWKKARDGAIVRVLFGAGLKLSEAIALEVQDFNFSEDGLALEVRGTKARIAPVMPVVTAYLQAWIRARSALPITDHLAFPASLAGEPLNPSTVYRMVRRVLEAHGVDKRHLGTGLLRNTFAVRQLANEVPLEAVQDWIGHRRRSSTENLMKLVANRHGVLPR